MPRTLAILLIYILFFGGIGYGIYKGTPVVIKQLQEINEQSRSLQKCMILGWMVLQNKQRIFHHLFMKR